MSTTSDSDSDTSHDPEGVDPKMKAVFKAMEKANGGEIIALGPNYNYRLNSVWYNEPNATRRLLQLLAHTEHWYTLSVERELEKPDRRTPELSTELKKRLKAVIRVFKNKYERDLCSYEDGYDSDEYVWQHWTPILVDWELYKGHAQTRQDMGELVFANKSNKQFVLVNLCGPKESADGKERYHEDYEARLLAQAHRFLALLHYLPLDTVEWVRATYITTDYRKLHPKLFDYSLPTQPAQGEVSTLFHLTPDMVKKCLTEKDLAALDTYISVCEFNPPDNKVKSQVLLPEGAVDPTAIELKWLDVNLGQSPLEKKCDGCDRFFAPTQLKASFFTVQNPVRKLAGNFTRWGNVAEEEDSSGVIHVAISISTTVNFSRVTLSEAEENGESIVARSWQEDRQI